MTNKVETGRGKTQDNALKALVTGPVFQQRVERNRKGKGAYQRKEKHARGWEASRKLH